MRANDAPNTMRSAPSRTRTSLRGKSAPQGMGKYHSRWGFEALTNAHGALYHSPLVDPALKYPPHAQHKREPKVEMKLLPRTSGLSGGRAVGRLKNRQLIAKQMDSKQTKYMVN